MPEQNSVHIFPVSPPPSKLLPVLQKLKGAYLSWFEYYRSIPKTHRFTLGLRIDGLLVDCVESISVAGFTRQPEKLPHVQSAIRKLDTAKFLLLVLWETKSLDNKKYIALSEKLEEVGRMLGGWNGKLVGQNSPDRKAGEK